MSYEEQNVIWRVALASYDPREMRVWTRYLEERNPAIRCTGYRSSRPLLERMRQQAGRRWCFEGARDWRKPRTRQAVYYDLKKAAAKFGLPQNISPHTLRKNYAVYLRHKGKTVGQVQRTLNHSNAMTTMLYMYADKLTEQKKTRALDTLGFLMLE